VTVNLTGKPIHHGTYKLIVPLANEVKLGSLQLILLPKKLMFFAAPKNA
jgi:hypothetical protein